jgi:hypothetical protein
MKDGVPVAIRKACTEFLAATADFYGHVCRSVLSLDRSLNDNTSRQAPAANTPKEEINVFQRQAISGIDLALIAPLRIDVVYEKPNGKRARDKRGRTETRRSALLNILPLFM